MKDRNVLILERFALAYYARLKPDTLFINYDEFQIDSLQYTSFGFTEKKRALPERKRVTRIFFDYLGTDDIPGKYSNAEDILTFATLLNPKAYPEASYDDELHG